MLRLSLLLLLVALPALAAPPVFFVAPNGNDTWSGTLAAPNEANNDGPFATLLKARDALRATGTEAGLPDGGTVYVRGGSYYMREPLALDARDSGAEGRPVLWQAYKDEAVTLIGGVAVPALKPFKDNILQADCTALNLSTTPGQLFLDGERQPLARWPNKGEGELPGGGWAFVKAQVPDAKSRSFVYSGEVPGTLASVKGLEASIWPNYNWWQTITPVAAIDPAAKTISFPADVSYTIEPGRRYFLQNALELLDAPGEWFYDAEKSTLYFWPPKPLDANTQVILPVADLLIKAEALHTVSFIGLSVEASRGDGVLIKDCTDVLFARATVRNTYGFGIVTDNCTSVRIRGNDIHDTGKGGITLAGGDRKTLTPGNNEAVNNHIHHYAQLFNTYNCGVNISGVGNRIQNNSIHDAPHIGILLTGNEHLIEYNDIHHVCMEGADNGGFYMGRDWTQRGNMIRFNRFHDIYGFGLANLGPDKDGTYRYEAPHQAWGVYLDDCTSGTTIYGNLFYRVPLSGVMIGGGRDNVVENNIFVECTPALHIDDRWDAYPWALMKERLEAMNYTQPPYSERYPELLTMGDDPRTPANNRFSKNVVQYTKDSFRGLSTTAPHPNKGIIYDLAGFDPATTTFANNLIDLGALPLRIYWRAYKGANDGDLTWEQWRKRGFDTGTVLGAAEFVDPENGNYNIRRFAKAAEGLNLAPIPVERIGLYEDEFRVTRPVEKDTRTEGAEHREWRITVE